MVVLKVYLGFAADASPAAVVAEALAFVAYVCALEIAEAVGPASSPSAAAFHTARTVDAVGAGKVKSIPLVL